MFIKDSILILPYEQDLTIKSLTNVYTGATNLYLSLESGHILVTFGSRLVYVSPL